MGPALLVPIFIVWAVTCAAVGTALLRRAPAVSLALFGSVLGAIGGFLVGNADGPAEVPAYTAVGASVGLFANGGLGVFATTARPPSEPLRRAAWIVLIAGPLVAGVLTMLLQVAFSAGSLAGPAVGGRHGPQVAASGCWCGCVTPVTRPYIRSGAGAPSPSAAPR